VDFNTDEPPIMDVDVAPANTPLITRSKSNTSSSSSTTPRTNYGKTLTEKQKESINNGDIFLPSSDNNTSFDPKNIFVACKSKECESALNQWWSSCTKTMLYTAKDIKNSLALCDRCLHSKSINKVMASISRKQPLDVQQPSSKKKVPVYEIGMKKM